MAHQQVSPARGAAYVVLLRAASSKTHTDLSLAAAPELSALEERDGALALELVSGTLRRRNSIDAVLRSCSKPALRSVAPAVLTALRLGAYQLLYLDRVPAHAAVDQSVTLVARRGRGTRGYVNAVLRTVAATGRTLLEAAGAGEDPASLAVRWSHPEWLVRLWIDELGHEAASALLRANNTPPERCLRVNTLVGQAEAAVARLALEGVHTTAAEDFSLALAVQSGPSVERTAAFREGLVTPQSRGSQLAGMVAAGAVRSGDAVADLCAAPGIKATQLAAAVPGARVLAVDEDARRVEELRATARRLRAPQVEALLADVLELPASLNEAFAAVLLDAPCSGLGTLASRPDLRWRRSPNDVERLAGLQRRLLRRAAALVRPDGVLTYSVCTITRAETIAVLDDLLRGGGWRLDDLGAEHPRFVHPERGGALLTLPSSHGTSGFFVARVRRETQRPRGGS
jgi:16S rRNA (cytosine967-C5)-methyltransferase